MKALQKTALILMLISAIMLLAGCWNSRELRDLAIVVGMGVDKEPNSGQYRVSFQMMNPGMVTLAAGGGGGGGSSTITVYSASDKTLFGALRKASLKVPRQLFFAHIQLLVVGEVLAREGIETLFDFYERSHELRLNTPVLIARGLDAETVLQIIMPMENNSALGNAKRLKNTAEIWSHSIETKVTDIVKGISGKSGFAISGVRIVGDSKAGGGKDNLQKVKLPAFAQISGIGLFHDGKLVHWVDGTTARGMMWAQDKMKSTIVNIGCEEENDEGVSIEVTRSKTNVKFAMVHGKPAFTISIKEEGNVNEVHCPVDVSKREVLLRLQKAWEAETRKEVEQALGISQKKKTEVFGFNEIVASSDRRMWKKIKDDWPDVFAESKVTVEVEAFIRRTGMRSKSYLSEKQ